MFGKYDNCSELAVKFADKMLEEGVYVIAFSFPVVPRGKDRIRVQISAAHTEEALNSCNCCFQKK